MVRLILLKVKDQEILETLAYSETEVVEQIYCKLYNIS